MSTTNGADASLPHRQASERKSPAGRRGNGDGTFYYDQQLQRWRGEILLDGRRRKVSGKTEREVRRKMADLRQDFFSETLTEPHRLTVGAYLNEWLETVVRTRRRLSTYRQYESLLRVHVMPRLGSKRLPDLHPRDLERLYADLEAGVNARAYKRPGRALEGPGLAPKSIRSLHAGLRSAFACAVRHRLLRSNPAEAVELPSLSRRSTVAVDPDDVQRLLAHTGTTGDRTHALWCFLANTGLRIGEALALRWANVDLQAGWFTVEEDLDPGGRSGDPKTTASIREMPLTEAALAALREHLAAQQEERGRLAEGYADRDLVFPTATGRPNSERNVLRSLKAAARRAGLTRKCLAARFPPCVRQPARRQWRGHRNGRGHPGPQAGERAAGRLRPGAAGIQARRRCSAAGSPLPTYISSTIGAGRECVPDRHCHGCRGWGQSLG